MFDFFDRLLRFTRVVRFSRRHALWVVLAAVTLTVIGGYYAVTHLSVDTDTDNLIDPNLPWRQREQDFDRHFPQFTSLIVVVLDAEAPDQAGDAAAALAAKLKTESKFFKSVERPDGSEFFQREGILLLPKKEVQDFADQIVAAQPMIGTLAADPSLRGLFDTLDLAAQGIERDEAQAADLEHPFSVFADTVEASLAGKYHPLSWQMLLTGRKPDPQELRRFILVQPVLDYTALQPGGAASAAIRQAAKELGLTPERGIRVRLTGPVPLSDEEFASVADGAAFSTALCFGLICLLLFLALRQVRLVVPILVTLAMGLILTLAFAALSVQVLNLISVAFAVLFIGIAVDFSIQFSIRYRAERHTVGDFAEALKRTAGIVGAPLSIAAATTAVGFLSFVPTAYTGVSDLGLISGVGMIIALVLNLTVLPALLVLMRPRGERMMVGFRWAGSVDRFLLGHRLGVSLVAGGLAVVGLVFTPHLQFDFNPLNLKDPRTESMSTLLDLMKNPDTTPLTIDVLADSPAEAAKIADELDKLPEVARTITVMSFVPDDQPEKLAIIGDAAMLLGPTLSPPNPAPPPIAEEEFAALKRGADAVARAAAHDHKPTTEHLATVLQQAVQHGPEILPVLRGNLITGLGRRLDELRLALSAGPVTLDTLPPDIRNDWVAPDGDARIDVFPKGDVEDNTVLRQFVTAVRKIAPDATGAPVSIQESARTIVDAFETAGFTALVAIALLLIIVLRRVFDVALVLAPLVLAGLLTVSTSVIFNMPLNFANIIALPLLLGIGVAFDIYFVMNWRAGREGPLQSSTARAVLFSALTTATAFGSLALSKHTGTSEMGILLTIALAHTLVCTFVFLPAFMGPVRPRQ
jgi:uncharacterized protein